MPNCPAPCHGHYEGPNHHERTISPLLAGDAPGRLPRLFFAGPVPIPGRVGQRFMRTLLDVSALPNLSLSPFAAILAEVMVRWERKNGKGPLQALSPLKQDRFPRKNDEKIQKGQGGQGLESITSPV